MEWLPVTLDCHTERSEVSFDSSLCSDVLLRACPRNDRYAGTCGHLSNFHKLKVRTMTHIEVWFMALALAMDCFAVAIASGIFFKKVYWKPMLTMAFLFGFFQALNPFLGWWGTDLCRALIENVDHWVAFAILGFLGVRMIIESFKEEEEKRFNPRRYKVIFTLAIATSIDALAVGISFSCMGYHTVSSLCYPLAVIFLVSFVMTIIGLALGLKFGNGFAKKLRAEMWGGIILLFIGARVLIEHLTA